MKLATQQCHDEVFTRIYKDNEFQVNVIQPDPNAKVSVRIYASGKKAKRAVQAMTKNGWTCRKPAVCQVAMLPAKNKLRRRKGPITEALPRMVVFYRR